MNYRDFNLDDWIGHISGVIGDETTLDGNDMRDLVEFLTTLKQYPTTKNDLGIDNQNIRLIDSDALIKRLRPKHFDWWGEGEQDDFSKGNNSMLEEVIEAIEEFNPVTPIRPKGHWISHREHCEMNNLLPSGLGSYFWCSECDCGIDSKDFTRVNYNYCPNCGADMREVEE